MNDVEVRWDDFMGTHDSPRGRTHIGTRETCPSTVCAEARALDLLTAYNAADQEQSDALAEWITRLV